MPIDIGHRTDNYYTTRVLVYTEPNTAYRPRGLATESCIPPRMTLEIEVLEVRVPRSVFRCPCRCAAKVNWEASSREPVFPTAAPL